MVDFIHICNSNQELYVGDASKIAFVSMATLSNYDFFSLIVCVCYDIGGENVNFV